MQNKILIVEDDFELRELLVTILEMSGFKVFSAGCAEEAWQISASNEFDAFLLDLMLPDMDGISLCEMLRKLPRTSNACIIMVTAWVTKEALNLGLEAGADDYVTKPFNRRNLVGRLNAKLQERGLLASKSNDQVVRCE